MALSHPVRRCVLRELHSEAEALDGASLAVITGVSISEIGYHLGVLSDAGLVKAEESVGRELVSPLLFTACIADKKEVLEVLEAMRERGRR